MNRPRVVSSQTRPAVDRKPPGKENIKAHQWLSSDLRSRYDRILARNGIFDLYVSKLAAEKMVNHTRRFARIQKESLGFLLGDICSYGEHRFVMVRDIVTGALKSSSDRVRFDRDSLAQLFMELDSSGFDYVIAGWYHSHLGYGCFMSRTDMNTQRATFCEEYHSAIVLDPLQKQIQAFSLKGGRCTSLDFAVFWHDLENPYRQNNVRMCRVVKNRVRQA